MEKVIHTISLLLFIFTAQISYAQGKSFAKASSTVTQIPDLNGARDSVGMRMSWNNFILEISSLNGNFFSGRLTIYTSTYVEGDHKSLYSKKYSTQVRLNSDTIRAIFKLFDELKVANIQTDRQIKGWRRGTDGITYSIEYTKDSVHSLKEYWTPSAIKNVSEAQVIDKFISQTELLLDDRNRWEKFLSSLPTGNSYRYGGLGIITVSNPKDKVIDRVTVQYQEADEPPVVGGRPEFVLEFNRHQSNLICTSYITGAKKTILEDTITLQPKLVQAIVEWSKNKKSFSLDELGIRPSDLEKAPENETRYKLSFPMPNDPIFNLDSMSLCRKNLMLRTFSTGYDEISVLAKYADGSEEIFNFDTKDLATGFNLHNYFTCYIFLNDLLPEEFPAYRFFSTDKLIDLLYEYQKIVECEGYYYKEYSSKHPEFTPQERRMMKGWDFKKYLQEKRKSKDGQ